MAKIITKNEIRPTKKQFSSGSLHLSAAEPGEGFFEWMVGGDVRVDGASQKISPVRALPQLVVSMGFSFPEALLILVNWALRRYLEKSFPAARESIRFISDRKPVSLLPEEIRSALKPAGDADKAAPSCASCVRCPTDDWESGPVRARS